MLHVIFMKLIDRFLPGPDSDEMKELLDQEIRHTIRDFKLDKRPMLDIERVNPDDGPSYEEQSWTEEAEFERAFERFCNQCEEPKSSVYLRSRTHSKKQLSRIYGIHEKRIYKMLDKMADEFDDFLKKFRE